MIAAIYILAGTNLLLMVACLRMSVQLGELEARIRMMEPK